METERYLVTGAGGFVGSVLTGELARRGLTVRGLVRKPEQTAAIEALGAESALGDVRDAESLRRAVEGVSGIYHIAALFRQADQPDSVYYDINAEGTRRVLEAARAAGVRRVVHCSTIGVLGDVKEVPATETTPYNPGDVYQRSKLEGEKIALECFRSGAVSGTVIRPAMIYGPGDTRNRKIFKMIARRCFFYVGRGANLVHFVDVRDLARAFVLAMEHPDVNGEIFIVAGNRYMPLREFAGIVADRLGVPPPRLHLPVRPMQALGTLCETVCKPLGVNPPLYRRRVDFFTKDRAFDCRKVRDRLGFKPQQDVEAEVDDILADYKKRGWL
jgi:nucleoside-diphosphate-sugar epimerase